jgi:hypothetical protein
MGTKICRRKKLIRAPRLMRSAFTLLARCNPFESRVVFVGRIAESGSDRTDVFFGHAIASLYLAGGRFPSSPCLRLVTPFRVD